MTHIVSITFHWTKQVTRSALVATGWKVKSSCKDGSNGEKLRNKKKKRGNKYFGKEMKSFSIYILIYSIRKIKAYVQQKTQMFMAAIHITGRQKLKTAEMPIKRRMDQKLMGSL